MINLFIYIFNYYYNNFFYLLYNVSSSPWMIHYIISIAFSQMERAIEEIRIKNTSILNNIYTPTEISVGMVKEAKILLLSIGGDPELPIEEEMTHPEFRDGSCPFAAEVKIPPLYIKIDKNLIKYIETTTKVVVQYLIKCIAIWGWWLKRMGYTPTYNPEPGPYGGHIHFRISSSDINALENISRAIIKTLNTIGAVKALQWFEWERYEDNYYQNTCHIKIYGTYNGHETFDSSYKEGSRNREYIHIEWRNPPFYVWYSKKELYTVVLPVLINTLEELYGIELVGSIEYIRRRVKEIE